jgi:hypothetical protein
MYVCSDMALVVITMTVLYIYIKRLELMQLDDSRTAEYQPWRRYHRFYYGALSGIVGAQSVLFGKLAAELIANTFAGRGSMFVWWQSYAVIGGMLASIFTQIKWLNSGLLRFDALTLVPIFQAFWILVSVAGGLVFFGEAASFSLKQAIMFPVGVLVTVAGVFALSLKAIALETVGDQEKGADRAASVSIRSPLLKPQEPESMALK